MDPTERVIDEFDAVDDEGRKYRLAELERIATFQGVDGVKRSAGGRKRLIDLDTGEHVNPLHDGTFELYQSRTIVRRVDP